MSYFSEEYEVPHAIRLNSSKHAVTMNLRLIRAIECALLLLEPQPSAWTPHARHGKVRSKRTGEESARLRVHYATGRLQEVKS